jgi:hypothetical protein
MICQHIYTKCVYGETFDDGFHTKCVGIHNDALHYVKTSNRSRNICNGPLTPITCTHICNGYYLVLVTDMRGRPTPGLASATPVTNVDFW